LNTFQRKQRNNCKTAIVDVRLVNDRGTKFSRGQCPAGAFIHIYRFSYLKERKSNVYPIYMAMVDVILKMCSYNFSQWQAKSLFLKCEVEILIK